MALLILSLKVYTQTKAEFEKICEHSEFTPELFIRLVNFECKHPEWVIRQAKLETGNFTSDNFKKNHNLFGMKYSERGYCQKSKKTHYAVYRKWVESVYDYRDWQEVKYKQGNYLSFLQSVGYAEDKKYINKLKSIEL